MASAPHEGFVDRTDAGERLAAALARYKGTHPLILGIPRGGVPVGRIIADALDGELDVVLVRKIGAPDNPEFAIGAVDEHGHVELAEYAASTGADGSYVQREAERQLALIRERRASYSPHQLPADPNGRTVIVVDDGLATGATMRAALEMVRAAEPKHLVCAVPVGAPRSLREVAALADEVVCLVSPVEFRAVGQFYRQFPAVEDDEVIRLLRTRPQKPPAGAWAAPEVVQLPFGGLRLQGDLTVPQGARALVVFAHGSGSSRKSPRNRFVADELNRRGLATLLFDLLTEHEDSAHAARFDIALLTERLAGAVAWTRSQPTLAKLALGLFGASTGAAAALRVAALHPGEVGAVVSRGGRPDLAGIPHLERVTAPTLLIVGGADTQVITLNRMAMEHLRGTAELTIVPGATHLFDEAGALERVAEMAGGWFQRQLIHAEATGRAAPTAPSAD